MFNKVLNYARFQDDIKINVEQELEYMRKKEFVSKLDEIRRCFSIICQINKTQERIIMFEMVIRLSIIFNFFVFEDVSVLMQVAFYSCVFQTITSIITYKARGRYGTAHLNKSFMAKFFEIFLLLLQFDSKYLFIDIRQKNRIKRNERQLVDSNQKECDIINLWFFERRIFTVFRMMIFICEIFQRSHGYFFLIFGTIYSTASLLVLNYIFVQAFYLNLTYDLRERLLIMFELLCQFVQAFLNQLYLMSGSIHFYVLSYYSFASLLWYYVIVQTSFKFTNINTGILENFFFGQKLCFITSLQKRDMKQFDQVASSCTNAMLQLIYFVFQLIVIKYYLIDDNHQQQIMIVLQLKILVINIICLFIKIYLLKGLSSKKQSYQAEDIVMAEQYRNKTYLKVYIKIQSQNQLYISDEDHQVLEEMLSSQIEEFYLGFEKEFEIYSKRGNIYLKINSIRYQAEIERVFLAILNSCRSFDFEIDRDLVSLPKLDKFMHLLLKNCIFSDELKIVMKKEEILDYFEKREIDYKSFVDDFVCTCPAIIQLTAYYKYINHYMKLKPITILEDIGS